MVLAKRRRARRSTTRRRRNVQTIDSHGACPKNLKERKPWLTPAESCESDEKENEGTEPSRAPPGLPEPPKIREPTLEWETASIAKAETRPRPKLEQIMSVRTFEENAESNGDLNKQMRPSILSWNAGTKRAAVTNSTIGSFHVIIIQEAETHQLVHCRRSTFEREGVKIQKFQARRIRTPSA